MDVVAATVVGIIIRADSVMARSGIVDNKFNAPFFHYQAPSSVTIRSVMNPAHNRQKCQSSEYVRSLSSS